MKRVNELISQFPDSLGALLAEDKLDASGVISQDGTGQGKIPPDTHNRTILIGLGGTGVRTVSYVKRSIQAKLDPSWVQYISFLGVDADSRELEKSALAPNEQLMITLPGVEGRAKSPAYYPVTWQVFAEKEKVERLTELSGDGSGRKRLMGKMKIHDRMTGSSGMDQRIVQAVGKMKSDVLAPIMHSNGRYEVYVIGSVSGGTCSGGLLEMPALIRKALNVPAGTLGIYAMLYLPDTLLSLDSAREAELKANGYATLKELNYFQGIAMRRGYSEKWTYNDPASRELVIGDDLFNIPYLVGTRTGAAKDSAKVAQETIAEFFISILGEMRSTQAVFMTDSFMSNAMQHRGDKSNGANPEMETPGAMDDFPKHYGAIGFASASAPQQIVKAYAVGHACRKAGIQSVDETKRALLKGQNVAFLPFMGEKQFFNASEGTQRAETMLQPLMDFLGKYQNNDFDLSKIDERVRFDDIFGGLWEQEAMRRRIEAKIEEYTNLAAMDELDKKLKEAYASFRENAMQFVKEFGPYAFANLYEGNFIEENGDYGIGLKTMLDRICSGKDVKTGVDKNHAPSDDAREKAEKFRGEITEQGGVLGKLLGMLGTKRETLADSWVKEMNNWGRQRINEKRREHILKKHHSIDTIFVVPAMLLADDLKTFAKLVSKLAEIYQTQGGKLDDYNQFRDIQDNATEVNIAATNMAAHAWLKQEAESISENINGMRTREALVDSFFANPDKWLDVEDLDVEVTAGNIRLTNPETAIGAREAFDECVKNTINVQMNVSIDNLFAQVNDRNVDYDQYAMQIITRLMANSKPLVNGVIAEDLYHRYIVYPANLNSQVVTAITNAAQSLCPDVQVFSSMDADRIMMYQQATPFEIYHLRELKEWGNQYGVMKENRNNGLHGRSPDLSKSVDEFGNATYSENTSWFDYPAIVNTRDDQDQHGNMEKDHEEKVRKDIDVLLEEARKLGILYEKQVEPGKYSFFRAYCPKDWEFDEMLMKPDPVTELLPTGEALIRAVAQQNGKTLEEISRVVELHTGGQMEKPHSQAWAWTYAKRTLYVHRPMLIEIRESVEKIRQWNKAVEDYNVIVMQKWKPAKMIRIMQAHLLYSDDQGFWMIGENDEVIANLSDAGKSKLRRVSPKNAALLDGGFLLYSLYKFVLDKKWQNGESLDTLLEEAKDVIRTYEDEEVLDASFDYVDKHLKEEVELVKSLGGNLDEPDKKPLTKFVKAMDERDIDEGELSDLCRFYKMAQLWKKV